MSSSAAGVALTLVAVIASPVTASLRRRAARVESRAAAAFAQKNPSAFGE